MQKELLRAGAVVDYSKRSKSFYKNAKKLIKGNSARISTAETTGSGTTRTSYPTGARN